MKSRHFMLLVAIFAAPHTSEAGALAGMGMFLVMAGLVWVLAPERLK